MARGGLFGNLKGVDAFGKVSANPLHVNNCQLKKYSFVDYGRCEGEDEDGGVL